MDYDIVIIGAGPAGATLARLLKGMKLAVIDKKSQESSFRKPCGGLLAPDAQRSLAKFELNLPSDVLAHPQIFSVKTIDLNSGIVRHYPRHYINMDRHKFDMWLISLIPDSVDCFLGSRCTRIQKEGAGYAVFFSIDGEERKISAKYIVGADGAHSIVRRTFFKSRIKSYTSIQQWFRYDTSAPIYTAVFDNTVTDSYAWGLEKDGYFIFGAALPVLNARQHFEKLKEKLKGYGYSFDELVKTESCQVLTPLRWSDTLPGEKNIFLVGEAGGFISPSSLEGLSYAMDTASMLADAFNRSLSNALDIYKKKICRLQLKLFAKKFKMPFMYNRQLRKWVMKSGLTAIK